MKHLKLLLSVCVIVPLAACTTVYQANSPEVAYSADSATARTLQIPPDLTDLSDGEQFILPGNTGDTASRNTLLPVFESVRFVRDGGQSWLEIDQQPEDIWPRLLEFARQQKYRIEKTEPVAGVIVTQWRSSAAVQSGGLLKNLIGGDDAYTRVAFRLERSIAGSRLFTRSQSATEEVAKANAAIEWPASSHDPEQTSALLTRLLIFLGVDEQRSKGVLSQAQARDILDDAIVQSTAAGSQLVVHRGYLPSFVAINAALNVLDFNITSSDDNTGRIEAVKGDQPTLVITLAPVHVSAVRVTIADSEGQRLPPEKEREVLDNLREQLA